MNIKVKYHADIEKLEINPKGDWIDLRAAEDVEIKKGESKMISLGISVELPKGYEANIVPRSSTFKNFGIIQANHYGVIDSSFCGDNDIWQFMAIAFRDTTIKKNDRICQFRLNKTMMSEIKELNIVEATVLGNEDRGGIGSSGTK